MIRRACRRRHRAFFFWPDPRRPVGSAFHVFPLPCFFRSRLAAAGCCAPKFSLEERVPGRLASPHSLFEGCLCARPRLAFPVDAGICSARPAGGNRCPAAAAPQWADSILSRRNSSGLCPESNVTLAACPLSHAPPALPFFLFPLPDPFRRCFIACLLALYTQRAPPRGRRAPAPGPPAGAPHSLACRSCVDGHLYYTARRAGWGVMDSPTYLSDISAVPQDTCQECNCKVPSLGAALTRSAASRAVLGFWHRPGEASADERIGKKRHAVHNPRSRARWATQPSERQESTTSPTITPHIPHSV